MVNFSFVGGFLTIALAGLVVDALGDRFVLVLGGLLAGAAAIAAAVSPNFWVLLLVLVVMGVGVATPTPAGSVAVRRAFPLRVRGMVMSIRQTGIPFGSFFAALSLPSIAIGRGWRPAMVVAGLISIVVALIALALYRSAGAVERVEGSKRGLVSVFNRDSAIASAGGVFLVAAQMSLLTYLVSYLVHDRRLSLTTAAGFLAIAQLGGAGARVLWGVVSDRLLGGSRRTALLLAAATGAVGSLLLAALPAGAPFAVLLPAILVAAAGAVGWNGVQISYLSELAQPGTEGRNVGIGLMIQQPGILAGPFVFGLVADLTGSFRLAWVLLAAFLATAMVIVSASRESIPTAEAELA
ncbi:MAG: MFS transporter [Candidatus Dormibacteraeota bacterium]|nr:MFS transporter [Candidatus Dormibacteraeota bacterium]